MHLRRDPSYQMKKALQEAHQAFLQKEVPVGAVLVESHSGRLISRAYNRVEQLCDATAHAEILALTGAMSFLGSKYLPQCTLYVTLEPCVMCLGALRWAQIGGLVYAAPDAIAKLLPLKAYLHPSTKATMMQAETAEAQAMLKTFFQQKRNQNLPKKN